jgi:hypothetical protein
MVILMSSPLKDIEHELNSAVQQFPRKETTMNRLALVLLLLVSFSVSAKQPTCSIHPNKDTPASALPGLAKVSKADAEKIALARIKASSKNVVDGELEVERGCLVYSFDIRISGKKGVEEVRVDAGTGKILSHKHESAKQEAAEQAKDKAPSK